jgi:Protein of unknown function (DUF1003)
VQAGTVRDARFENLGSHKPAPKKRAPIVGLGLEGVFIQEPAIAGHQRSAAGSQPSTTSMTTREPAGMPHHVGDAVATIAALHAAHDREARALQRAVSRATSGIAQPGTLILITLAIAIWVITNLILPEFGHAALDPFPFSLLGTIVSTIALYLAAMILMTQRHDDEMAGRDTSSRGALPSAAE